MRMNWRALELLDTQKRTIVEEFVRTVSMFRGGYSL
jgi:hypothetical protein